MAGTNIQAVQGGVEGQRYGTNRPGVGRPAGLSYQKQSSLTNVGLASIGGVAANPHGQPLSCSINVNPLNNNLNNRK
jgi:hypothetical protein